MNKYKVDVIYQMIDNCHFFTTKDPKWLGLCVMSNKYILALQDVSCQLKILAKYNYNEEDVEFDINIVGPE